MLSGCAGNGSAVTIRPWPRWGVPHSPNPVASSSLESVSASAQPFSPSRKVSVVSAWELWWVVLISLKMSIFLKLVSSNTNHLMCKPPMTEAGTRNSERCLQELGLPLLWGCAHCQKLKALIPPALGAKSEEFQIKQISCKLWTSPSCAYAPESEQCK